MCQQESKLMLMTICLTGLMGVYVQAAVPPGSYQVQIVAADMCCKGCVQKVSGQLYAAPGVMEVSANLENRTVVVTVSQKKGASLEQLWQAVAAGKGGPTQLTTSEATFSLTPAESLDKRQILPATKSHIIVENLSFEGRAQKIANQLYTTKGVVKVSADAQQNALIVTSQQAISPWALIAAVARAQERPVAIVGAYGQMNIAWSNNQPSNSNQQAQQSNNGGIQR
jgi:copper chaperone CopZ